MAKTFTTVALSSLMLAATTVTTPAAFADDAAPTTKEYKEAMQRYRLGIGSADEVIEQTKKNAERFKAGAKAAPSGKINADANDIKRSTEGKPCEGYTNQENLKQAMDNYRLGIGSADEVIKQTEKNAARFEAEYKAERGANTGKLTGCGKPPVLGQ